MLADLSTIDTSKQSQPYFIYQRLNMGNFTGRGFSPVYFTFQLDYGFGYLLRRVSARWAFYGQSVVVTPLSPEMYIAFFQRTYRRALQLQPIPLNLFSQPCVTGNSTVHLGGTGGVTVDNIAFDASPRYSSKRIDLYFPYRGTIEAQISGQDTGTTLTDYVGEPTGNPVCIDIVMEGYYIPDKTIKVWG